MFRNTIIDIFELSWPMVLICCVILISMRIYYIVKNKKPFIFYKEILMLGFVIYIMCLFRVVTFQDVSWSSSNFTPFREMFRYEFGTQLFFKNVVGNMFLFVPFGFFTSYFLRIKKPLAIFIMIILTSLTIECTQLLIGRVFDIDDIILNVVGGLLGFFIYYFIDKIKSKLPNVLKKSFIYNIIITLIIITIMAYLLGVFYV